MFNENTPPHKNNNDLNNQTPNLNTTQNKFAAIEQLKNNIYTQTPPPNSPILDNKTTPNSTFNILEFIKSNQKILAIILVAIIILSTGGFAYYYFIYRQGILALTYITTPDEMKIDGTSYDPNSNSIVKLEPGTYLLTATKNKYYPFTSQFEITTDQTTNIEIKLKPFPSPDELVEYTTSFPNLDPTGREISYLSNFGTTFYKINLNTFEKDAISSNVFNHITDIQWAKSARQANIIQSINDPKIHTYQTTNQLYSDQLPSDSIRYHLFDFSRYDLVNQNIIPYPETIHHPTWHPSKEEIVFQYLDPSTGENTLSKAKPNLENKQVMYDLPGFTDVLAKYSPDAEFIALVDTDQTATTEPNPVYLFETISRKFTKIPTKDSYKDILWSPDSTKIIAVKNNTSVSIIDVVSFETTDIDTKTDINRITWFNDSQKILYIPLDPTANDTIYTYNLATKQSSPLDMDSTKEFADITNPIINRDNSALYFLGDNFLYSLSLE